MADVNQGQDGGTANNAGGGGAGGAATETVETLTAKLAERDRQLAASDRTVSEYNAGKRLPKNIEERLRGEGFGELDEVLELAKKAKSGGDGDKGKVQVKRAADGAPVPPKPSEFRDPDTGEIDEDRQAQAQAAFVQATVRWDRESGQKADAAKVEEKAVGTSVQTLLKSLPKTFQAKEGDGDRLTAALAGLAAHNAIGDFATPEEIATTAADYQDFMRRFAAALLAETLDEAKKAKEDEPRNANAGTEARRSADEAKLLQEDPVKAGVAALAARNKR